MAASASTPLLIVSNRAPYAVRRRGNRTELVRTVGGLASTLDDLLRRHSGTWLAWSGNVTRRTGGGGRAKRNTYQSLTAPDGGYPLLLLDLTEEQVSRFYHGFSNRSLWPLSHYFIGRSRFDHEEWESYRKVNQLFARAAMRVAPDEGLTWIHDFHLTLVPQMLRKLRPHAPIAMFWHIPFPPAAVFRVNPWAREVIEGMLGSDLIGFHTEEYAQSFLDCVRSICGAKATVDLERGEAQVDGRTVRACSFPIGVEVSAFAAHASDPKIQKMARQIRADVETDYLLLAADRLDYTKGILERLEAYESFLVDNPAFHRRVSFIQIQVPSRENVPEYRELREQIDRKVGRITGRFSTSGWVPVRYLCRSFSRRDLTAYYRAADVMLVTPMRDGMNLVAQEFVASRVDEDGVLVFSSFAGAADRLREALFVNPYDMAGMADAIRSALRMRKTTRQRAMRAMRERVTAEDVDWWLGTFLSQTPIGGVARRDGSS